MSEYRLVARSYKDSPTVIEVGDEKIGAEELCIIAGPCAVESEEQIFELGKQVSDLGIKFFVEVPTNQERLHMHFRDLNEKVSEC